MVVLEHNEILTKSDVGQVVNLNYKGKNHLAYGPFMIDSGGIQLYAMNGAAKESPFSMKDLYLKDPE